MTNPILACEKVSKTYQDGGKTIEVLNNLDFKIQAGDKVAITGPSGSGKSTLLHILGGLDDCSSGQAKVFGQSWQHLSELKKCQARNQHLGFIYQFHHLLPEFTALENVMMPLLIRQQTTVQLITQQATEMLEAVGLAHRLQHRPAQLSGGERQRVAIARAVVAKPDCILADEPTGNLDSETAGGVFDLLLSLNDQFNTALVMVTHDLNLASQMDAQYSLNQGKLIEKR